MTSQAVEGVYYGKEAWVDDANVVVVVVVHYEEVGMVVHGTDPMVGRHRDSDLDAFGRNVYHYCFELASP